MRSACPTTEQRKSSNDSTKTPKLMLSPSVVKAKHSPSHRAYTLVENTPVIIIQNTGFLESGDAIRGTVFNMEIPVVSLIGYRGYHTMQPDAPRIDTAATFLEPTLKAWGLPYNTIETDDDIPYISEAFKKAQETSMPTAVLIVGIST